MIYITIVIQLMEVLFILWSLEKVGYPFSQSLVPQRKMLLLTLVFVS